MAKLDVKSAFRLIRSGKPRRHTGRPLLGFMIGGFLFFDTVLPFGQFVGLLKYGTKLTREPTGLDTY